jgi:hypothetical protein
MMVDIFVVWVETDVVEARGSLGVHDAGSFCVDGIDGSREGSYSLLVLWILDPYVCAMTTRGMGPDGTQGVNPNVCETASGSADEALASNTTKRRAKLKECFNLQVIAS